MANILIKEYRGFAIHYNELRQEFILTTKDNEDELRSADTQGKIERLADTLISSSKKLNPPIPAIVRDWGEYAFAKLTSYDVEAGEVWATTDIGDRGKHAIGRVYLDTENNRKLLEQISHTERESKRFSEQSKKLREQLIHFTPEDFNK